MALFLTTHDGWSWPFTSRRYASIAGRTSGITDECETAIMVRFEHVSERDTAARLHSAACWLDPMAALTATLGQKTQAVTQAR
jgi:hypothetical protein